MGESERVSGLEDCGYQVCRGGEGDTARVEETEEALGVRTWGGGQAVLEG